MLQRHEQICRATCPLRLSARADVTMANPNAGIIRWKTRRGEVSWNGNHYRKLRTTSDAAGRRPPKPFLFGESEGPI